MDSNNKTNEVNVDKSAVVPLAYHEVCMTRAHKTLLWMICAWALSVIVAIGIFAFMWLQYDYVGTTETTGVYVLSDAEGNVIAADLTPEDVIRIVDGLHGNDSTDPQP